MGCVYTKQASASAAASSSSSPSVDYIDGNYYSHGSSSLRKKEEFVEIRNGYGSAKPKLKQFKSDKYDSNKNSKSDGNNYVAAGEETEKKNKKKEYNININVNCSRAGNANGYAHPGKYINTEAEQVAAGWPSWLTSVAGEAIQGWIPRRADSFEKLEKIGQGTYSNVYKARDLESGMIVALKKVRFDNLEPESVRFMAREIQVLRRLDHPNVVKLEGLVTSRMSCSVYLVFEYMDHDLAGLAACPGIKFTEAQVKCYMQQLLSGLDHCHVCGILHRDIKGSNLLIDNEGILKIADFGLANFFSPGQKQPLTSRVVTLWYRPPELLLGATDYGVGVDLWSTGCILAELLAGKPVLPGRTEVEQLHKIFKLCGSPSEEYWKKSKLPHATIFKPQQPYKRCIAETFREFPQTALALIETLLAIESSSRGTAGSALKNEFFMTKPYACDPSSLPKYPPSKEFDVKLRDDESRRKRPIGGRGHVCQVARRVSRESRAIPAPDGNAELAASIQKWRLDCQADSKSKSEMFNSQQDDGALGFPIDPPRAMNASGEPSGTHQTHIPQSKKFHFGTISASGEGGLAEGRHPDDDVRMDAVWASTAISKSSTQLDLKKQRALVAQPAADLVNDCSSVATRNMNGTDIHNDGSDLHQCNLVDKIDGDLSTSDQRRVERLHNMEPFRGYGTQEDRVEYSGPLLPQSVNIDEMLEKHERKIQQAVRKARQDRGKIQKNTLSHTRKKVTEYKNWISSVNGNTVYDMSDRGNHGTEVITEKSSFHERP